LKISKLCRSGLIASFAVFSVSMGASAAPLIVGPGGSATISTSTVIDGASSNEGVVDIQSPSGALDNYDTLDNAGTLDNTSGCTLYSYNTLENSGTLDNTGTLYNYGGLNNSGTVTVETIGRVDGTGTFTQTAGQTTVNGTLTQRSVAINGGTLGGSGTVTAALSVGAAGTVGPGNSPGLMQVFGDADFLAGSTLAVELGGLAFGTEYDRLDVADDVATTGVTEGTVSLADGTVFDIDWFGAFTAGDGDFFDVLVADEFAPFNLLALIFDFSDAALGAGLAWEATLVDFGGGREALRLSVSATQTAEIPAPGVLAIFALGLAGLGYARRRKAA
jgi:hypothetical protein